MTGEWMTLGELRKGALFKTQDGVLAVKSRYLYDNGSQSLCVLLKSGEYAHFPHKDATLVCEVAGDQTSLEKRVSALELQLATETVVRWMPEQECQAKIEALKSMSRQAKEAHRADFARAEIAERRLEKAVSVIDMLEPLCLWGTVKACPVCRHVSEGVLTHTPDCPWATWIKDTQEHELCL